MRKKSEKLNTSSVIIFPRFIINLGTYWLFLCFMNTSNIKFILSLVICSMLAGFSQAQQITKVGTGEYYTAYLTDSGFIYVPIPIGNRYFTKKLNSQRIFRDIDCTQAGAIAIDDSGSVYTIGPGKSGAGLFATLVPNDISGKKFTGVEKVYGWGSSYLALKNGIPYLWAQDLLNLNGGRNIAAPFALPVPPGKRIKKLVPVSFDNNAILALATDGTVWRYSRNAIKPQRVAIAGTARDIAAIGSGVYVVETATDLLAWGFLGSYLGSTDMSTRPVSIKKQWTAAGCIFPSKQIEGNYGTLHIIDANNHLFGAGDNVHGEVGNGRQWPDWSSYSPLPFSWSYTHRQLLQRPVQVAGKFKKVCKAPNHVFYVYAQDMGGNWYSWGRNKARCLGNGLTQTPKDEATYPEALNVPAPVLVDPINVKWKQLPSFDPQAKMLPFVHAGINQYISSGNTSLNASSSSQQNGSIVSYLWKAAEGSRAVIESPNSAITKVSNLQEGENIFTVRVTNNYRDTAMASVTVLVRKN